MNILFTDQQTGKRYWATTTNWPTYCGGLILSFREIDEEEFTASENELDAIARRSRLDGRRVRPQPEQVTRSGGSFLDICHTVVDMLKSATSTTLCNTADADLLWSGCSPLFRGQLHRTDFVTGDDAYTTLTTAEKTVAVGLDEVRNSTDRPDPRAFEFILDCVNKDVETTPLEARDSAEQALELLKVASDFKLSYKNAPHNACAGRWGCGSGRYGNIAYISRHGHDDDYEGVANTESLPFLGSKYHYYQPAFGTGVPISSNPNRVKITAISTPAPTRTTHEMMTGRTIFFMT